MLRGSCRVIACPRNRNSPCDCCRWEKMWLGWSHLCLKGHGTSSHRPLDYTTSQWSLPWIESLSQAPLLSDCRCWSSCPPGPVIDRKESLGSIFQRISFSLRKDWAVKVHSGFSTQALEEESCSCLIQEESLSYTVHEQGLCNYTKRLRAENPTISFGHWLS